MFEAALFSVSVGANAGDAVFNGSVWGIKGAGNFVELVTLRKAFNDCAVEVVGGGVFDGVNYYRANFGRRGDGLGGCASFGDIVERVAVVVLALL